MTICGCCARVMYMCGLSVRDIAEKMYFHWTNEVRSPEGKALHPNTHTGFHQRGDSTRVPPISSLINEEISKVPINEEMVLTSYN